MAPQPCPALPEPAWIVALYLLSFLAGGLYHVLWKYAGERDLIRLGGMIAVPTGVVYFVNHFCVHGVLFDSANAMAAVLIFLLVGGSRLAWRLFLNHPIGERLRGVPNKDPSRPVMIVGAGEAGRLGYQCLQIQQQLRPPRCGGERWPWSSRDRPSTACRSRARWGRSPALHPVQHPQHHHCHPHPAGQQAEPCHRPLRFHPLPGADSERPPAGGQQRPPAGCVP